MASPGHKWPNAVLKLSVIRRLVRPIRAALAVIGRASSLGVIVIVPHTPEHQNGPGLSALIRGTAQNTTRIFPFCRAKPGAAHCTISMHYARSKRFAARRGGHPEQIDAGTFTLRAMTPPGQQENAATRSPRAGVAAALLSRWSQRWAASAAVRHAVDLHALFCEHAPGGRVRLRRCSMLPCPCVRRRRRARCGSPLVLCAQAGAPRVQALVHSYGEQLRNVTR